jgi:cation-transporting P-type ATPase 13A2
MKDEAVAMAAYTGFASHRGRIIRKIINNKVEEPEFAKSIIVFSVFSFLLTTLLYLCMIPAFAQMGMSGPMMTSEYLFMASFSVNFVGFIHMFPSFSLRRLRKEGIDGKEPYKVYESGKIKTICFDKTGTLTENHLKLQSVFRIDDGSHSDVAAELEDFPLLRQIFASCHMVKSIEGG